MITLALLNVFLVTAALAVVKLTPDRSLALRPPTVAARTIMPPASPPLAPVAATARLPSPGSLAARLAGPMEAAGLGQNLNGVVVDAMTGRSLFSSNAGQPAVPASTTKLITSVAVLASAGPERRLTTSVVRSNRGVILVGGGDPTLTTVSPKNAYPKFASLADLAQQTAAALKAAGTTRVTVDYDTSAYQGNLMAPGWKQLYFSPEGDVAPVSALELNAGRTVPGVQYTPRVQNPPLVAAQRFAQMLTLRGVTAHVGSRTTAPKGARRLGAVQSPPVSVLVEQLLTHSDDDIAEAMARLVAMNLHQPPTFAGGAAATHDVLARLGVGEGTEIFDGSGLSHNNRITPSALAKVLALAASPAHPELHTVLSGMPVAGFSGTLDDRFDTGTAVAGKGVVRAKTGTLDGVNTLAGVVEDADGRLLAFAFMANHVPPSRADSVVSFLDTLAATLAGCGCR
jgi:D-alanyl-D-alanine carboxypeptidase/D-alanyl-D-alanine-endopeptidase (penicillin-binding protein 4)